MSKRVKYEYQIFGFERNPMYDENKAKYKSIANTKKSAVGYIKLLIDNLDCGHIAIFKVKKKQNEK